MRDLIKMKKLWFHSPVESETQGIAVRAGLVETFKKPDF